MIFLVVVGLKKRKLDKIIITGASGFIGSALISRLKNENIEYIGLTRKKIDGLTQISEYSDYSDVKNSILIHLAQPNNLNNVSNGCEEIELLQRLLSKNWSHIIYISSATVYGDKIESPRSPDEVVFGYNDYTKVKLKSESLILNKGGTCLRFSNIYGPNMSTENVISEIIFQCLNSEKIIIKDKYPTRDFLYIDDAVNAIIQAIKLKPLGIFNIGSGVGTVIEELTNIVLKFYKEYDIPVFSIRKENGNSFLVLNIDKTKKELNWSPQVSLKQGLFKLLKNEINYD
jgi:UDP-glucose 4-epimerase